jgi:hypothetical protein
MTDLLKKYNLLDKTSKKEILDFTDFLLNKNIKSSKNQMADYKKKILNVSIWSDSDIDFILSNQKKFNQLKVQEW